MLVGFVGWVVCVYVLLGPDADAPVIASKEARLGHQVSERILAGRVCGLGGGCLKLAGPGRSCDTVCIEGGSFMGIASRIASLLVGFVGWVVSV